MIVIHHLKYLYSVYIRAPENYLNLYRNKKYIKRQHLRGNLLLWFKDYLDKRQQRVLINGQSSSWLNTTAGVPQGSVLGPLLFLLYINDLTTEVQHSRIRLFADDTCLFKEVTDREQTAVLINQDLANINKWSEKWLVKFSPSKTKSVVISNKKNRLDNPTLMLNGTPIEEVSSHTYLGIEFSFDLSWNRHINNIGSKAENRLNLLRPLKYKLDRKALETIYKSFIRPLLEYGLVVWGGTYDSNMLKLEHINVEAMGIITGATRRSNIAKLYEETQLQTISDRRDISMLQVVYKIKNDLAPNYLFTILPKENYEYISYNLRQSNNI